MTTVTTINLPCIACERFIIRILYDVCGRSSASIYQQPRKQKITHSTECLSYWLFQWFCFRMDANAYNVIETIFYQWAEHQRIVNFFPIHLVRMVRCDREISFFGPFRMLLSRTRDTANNNNTFNRRYNDFSSCTTYDTYLIELNGGRCIKMQIISEMFC